MTPLAFTVEGPPKSWQRAAAGKGGRIFTPKTTREYERRVKSVAMAAILLARGSWPRITTLRVSVGLSIFFADQVRRDLDNVVKACLDGMNRVVYADDSQVDEVHAYRYFDAVRPRVEFLIRILETAK
jgi:Holliday junction resolvase RusA-like endonuclease